jgi:hypothetical protein
MDEQQLHSGALMALVLATLTCTVILTWCVLAIITRLPGYMKRQEQRCEDIREHLSALRQITCDIRDNVSVVNEPASTPTISDDEAAEFLSNRHSSKPR